MVDVDSRQYQKELGGHSADFLTPSYDMVYGSGDSRASQNTSSFAEDLRVDGRVNTDTLVTTEEVEGLVERCVSADVDYWRMASLPDPGQVAMCAREFFDTYLSDTSLSLSDVADQYLKALVDELDARGAPSFLSPEHIESYVPQFRVAVRAEEPAETAVELDTIHAIRDLGRAAVRPQPAAIVA